MIHTKMATALILTTSGSVVLNRYEINRIRPVLCSLYDEIFSFGYLNLYSVGNCYCRLTLFDMGFFEPSVVGGHGPS